MSDGMYEASGHRHNEALDSNQEIPQEAYLCAYSLGLNRGTEYTPEHLATITRHMRAFAKRENEALTLAIQTLDYGKYGRLHLSDQILQLQTDNAVLRQRAEALEQEKKDWIDRCYGAEASAEAAEAKLKELEEENKKLRPEPTRDCYW